MNLQFTTICLYTAGFFALYILCRVFIKPIKWTAGLFFGCIVGSLATLVMNKIFSSLGFYVAINPLTAMMSGVLGLPGIALSYILGIIL